MKRRLSTREAAGELGITLKTLQRHVSAKTVPCPDLEKIGGISVRLWTAREIEKARKVLAGVKPGRKKKQE